MNKALKYCNMCKVNHCNQKAVMLFPEDKITWLVSDSNGSEILRLCETHKRIIQSFDKTKELIYVNLKKKKVSEVIEK